MIIWITGISGSGKTTIGKAYFNILKKKYKSSIFVDGDSERKVFQNDLKFSLKDRNLNAERLTRLVKFLSEQKINVVVSANLTSIKYRNWCKKNLKNYVEIFISAELKNLIKRDYKSLYKKSLQGKIKNVVGVDIKLNVPKFSNIYLTNNSTKKKFLKNLDIIKNYVKSKKIKIF